MLVNAENFRRTLQNYYKCSVLEPLFLPFNIAAYFKQSSLMSQIYLVTLPLVIRTCEIKSGSEIITGMFFIH